MTECDLPVCQIMSGTFVSLCVTGQVSVINFVANLGDTDSFFSQFLFITYLSELMIVILERCT